MTVPEEFGFRTVTELLGLTDNLPISLQLLLSASTVTITHPGRIATTDFRRLRPREAAHNPVELKVPYVNSLRRNAASSQSSVARARSSITALNSRFTTTARPDF